MTKDRLLSEGSGKTPTKDRLLSEGSGEAAPNPLFDPMKWLAGVKPIERTIRLYQRLDLLADRDEAANQRADLRMTDPLDESGQQAALTEQIRDLTGRINASGLKIRLQGMTRSKAQEVLQEAKDQGLTGDDANYYWLATQVIEPAGITWEWMKALDDALPVQFMQVVNASEQMANAVPDVEATVPF